jgi:hypothetical protein
LERSAGKGSSGRSRQSTTDPGPRRRRPTRSCCRRPSKDGGGGGIERLQIPQVIQGFSIQGAAFKARSLARYFSGNRLRPATAASWCHGGNPVAGRAADHFRIRFSISSRCSQPQRAHRDLLVLVLFCSVTLCRTSLADHSVMQREAVRQNEAPDTFCTRRNAHFGVQTRTECGRIEMSQPSIPSRG